MRTLETTGRKVKGLKSYSVCAHNLRTAKYALTLESKPYINSWGSAKAYKFDSLEDAIKCGEDFLNSSFEGIFAHKEFMKNRF